jgi:hypothetical protein
MVKVFNDILTIEQLSELMVVCGPHAKKMFTVEETETVLPYFADFLDSLDGKVSNIAFRYFNAIKGFLPHTDGSASVASGIPINTSVVIPLRWEPLEIISSTVMFNQLDVINKGKKFYKRSDGANNSRWGNPLPTSHDFSELINISDEPFDIDDYNKYLQFIEYDDLYGLSISDVVNWKLGSLIMFESNRLHSSGNIEKDKFLHRSHLLMKLNIEKN